MKLKGTDWLMIILIAIAFIADILQNHAPSITMYIFACILIVMMSMVNSIKDIEKEIQKNKIGGKLKCQQM